MYAKLGVKIVAALLFELPVAYYSGTVMDLVGEDAVSITMPGDASSKRLAE